MPVFCLVARDYADGLQRRLESRKSHIELGDRLVAEGKLSFGAAIMEGGAMKGSVLIGNFPDRASLDAWLAEEPYLKNGVWESVEIHEIRVGPSFVSQFPGLASGS